jgi:hypothetical protein
MDAASITAESDASGLTGGGRRIVWMLVTLSSPNDAVSS